MIQTTSKPINLSVFDLSQSSIRFLIVLLSLTLSLCGIGCGKKTDFPGEEWVVSTPAKEAVDGEQMQMALNLLKSFCGEDGLNETMIIRNGRIIFKGTDTKNAHNIWSCTKSFTSTLFGLLVEDGKCTPEDFAAKSEPLLKNQYSTVQLKHFATMTSGYSAKGDSRWTGSTSKDWSLTQFDPDEPLFEPDTAFAYWDEAQMMFGRVLTHIAEKSLKELFDEHIGQAIGFGEYSWWDDDKDLDGIPLNNGCTGIEINAEQLARFGHLILNQGNWDEQQLVPREWVREMTTNQVNPDIPVADTDRSDSDGTGCYGYNWWLKGSKGDMPDSPDSLAFMSGFNNNMCFIIPEWDVVVVRMGVDGNPPESKRFVYNLFFKELAKAASWIH